MVCDLTEHSYLLELEKVGSDAGTALDLKSRMLAEPNGKLWQCQEYNQSSVFDTTAYLASGCLVYT